MVKEVWIIGVHPACPRCDLTRQRVERVSKKIATCLNIRYRIYSDTEAKDFVKSIGKETGTARHVADKAGIHIDWNRVSAIVKDPPSRPEDFDDIDGIARQWSTEMDDALLPCREKADSVGILMTPILIVDKDIKHHGSVPSLDQLRMWLT